MCELPSLFCMMVAVANMRSPRRDAYKRYKQELDSLYALGEPQLERVTKL